MPRLSISFAVILACLGHLPVRRIHQGDIVRLGQKVDHATRLGHLMGKQQLPDVATRPGLRLEAFQAVQNLREAQFLDLAIDEEIPLVGRRSAKERRSERVYPCMSRCLRKSGSNCSRTFKSEPISAVLERLLRIPSASSLASGVESKEASNSARSSPSGDPCARRKRCSASRDGRHLAP